MRFKPQLSIIKGPLQDVFPCRLDKIFENNLLRYPNQPAIIYNDKSLTYEEVNSRSNQYARVLVRECLERSLKPNMDGDNIIAVCMQPSENLVMVLLAAWKAGLAYLPIDSSFPANRIEHILKEASPIMVVCDNDIDRKLFGSTCARSLNELNQKAIRMEKNNISEMHVLNGARDLAVVMYTSGSTGVPKGVRLPHAVVLNRLSWQFEKFPFTAEESTGVFKTVFTFIDSICEIWGPLLNGLVLLVVPKQTTKDPEKLVNLLEEYQIHRLTLVPTLLSGILMYLQMNSKSKVKLLRNLRNVVCSGELLSKHLVESFFDYFEENRHFLHNFYGSTEIMADVTYFTLHSKNQLSKFETVPIGLPISNTIIYILDEDYRPVRNGEIGEIYVAGSNLAQGYVNGRDPDRFIENPLAVEGRFSRLYQTGDFGSFQSGYIMYNVRTDSQVKIRGHRIDLSEVEKNIQSMDHVDQVIVLCYHPDQSDRSLLAFVKLKDASNIFTGLELESILKTKLADYMIPQVIVIDHLPLLVNGKVDRQALLTSYETENKEDLIAFDLSQVPDDMKTMASDLFHIVASVIGRSIRTKITLNSNFYEMGGNSLNSITTVMLLREKGYQIEISAFISAKNLGDILHQIAIEKHNTQSGLSRHPHLKMKAFPLTAADKEVSLNILTDSFFEKGDLELLIIEKLTRQLLFDIFHDVWDDTLRTGLSFTVKDLETNETIAVSINFDVRDEPEFKINSPAEVTFDIVEDLEAPFREKILQEELNKVMHSCLMCTRTNLTPQENITCIQFMEEEVLLLAKRKNFMAILTSNVSPLTQQLANDVFGYTCLEDFQVNKYIHKGKRPFAHAPDSQRLMIHYKEL